MKAMFFFFLATFALTLSAPAPTLGITSITIPALAAVDIAALGLLPIAGLKGALLGYSLASMDKEDRSMRKNEQGNSRKAGGQKGKYKDKFMHLV